MMVLMVFLALGMQKDYIYLDDVPWYQQYALARFFGILIIGGIFMGRVCFYIGHYIQHERVSKTLDN